MQIVSGILHPDGRCNTIKRKSSTLAVVFSPALTHQPFYCKILYNISFGPGDTISRSGVDFKRTQILFTCT